MTSTGNSPPSQPLHMTYRPDIDGLRAIAILAVLAFHAAPGWVRGGFVGVDIFFVISGFLITGIIVRNVDAKRFSYAEFYGRRIRRIFPALFIVLLATLAIGWFMLLPDEYEELGWQTIAATLFSSNLLLWSEAGYFDPSSSVKPLLHLWSLGIEEQYYLLWPLILILTTRISRHRTMILMLLGAASLAAYVWIDKRVDPIQAFYAPYTRFWELLIGSFLSISSFDPIADTLSRVRLSRFEPKIREFASGLGLIMILAAIAYSHPGIRSVLPTAGAALVIAAGPRTFFNRWLLSNRVAVYIGLISYPLYLWHWPLLAYVNIADVEGLALFRVLKLSALALAFVAAALTYLIVELPIRARPARQVAFRLSGAMVAPAALAEIILLFGGFFQRLNERDRLLVRSAKEETALADTIFRKSTCFLTLTQTAEAFSTICGGADRPEMFLWGDSHAAALYSGLKLIVSDPDRRISQYTAIECPPLLDFRTTFETNAHCVSINQAVAAQVRAHKPKILLLSAYWPLYYTSPGFAASLNRTLAELRHNAGMIAVVGPAVSFPKPQVKVVVGTKGDGMLRDRMISDLRKSDTLVRQIAESNHVAYISPFSSLCRDDSCEVFIPGIDPPQLLAFDYGHLTRAGSAYYASAFIRPIVEGRLRETDKAR